MVDTLGATAVQAAAIGAERIKGDIVTKTLDTLNDYSGSKGSGSGVSASDYDFQKTVLSAAYLDKGTIVSSDT